MRATQNLLEAWAHPGHGSDSSGISLAHYLGEPVHAFSVPLMLALVAVAGFSIMFERHRRR